MSRKHKRFFAFFTMLIMLIVQLYVPASAVQESLPAPTNLVNTNQDANTVTISWTPPISQTGITGYEVLQNGTNIATQEETTKQINGLAPGTYTFTVKAVYANGEVSGESQRLEVTIVSTEDIVNEDLQEIQIGYAEGNTDTVVTQNITLPTVGQGGSTITWDSNDSTTIDSNGVVTRPSINEGDKTVQLTATASYRGYSNSRSFHLTVLHSTNDFGGSGFDSAVNLTKGDMITGTIDFPNDVDYFKFTAPESKEYTFRSVGSEGSADTYGILYDDAGNVLGDDDDSGQYNQFMLRHILEAGKTYYLSIKFIDSNTVGDYHILVNDISAYDDVVFDYSNLEIGYTAGDNAYYIRQNITLPTQATYGSTITWASDNSNIIKSNGEVTRPAYSEGDAYVTLTATVKKGEYVQVKTFQLRVLRNDKVSDLDMVQADIEALTNNIGFVPGDDFNNVTQNVTLPSVGANGTTITWTSDSEGFLTHEGIVTRPTYRAGDRWALLQATVTKGAASRNTSYWFRVMRNAIADDGDKVQADYEALNIGYYEGDTYNSVTHDVELPTSGTTGSAITWESSNSNYVKPDGQVTRPSYSNGDQWVQLTAHITIGTEHLEKYFSLVILKNNVITDEDSVVADYERLEAGFAQGESYNYVTQNLTLVPEGNYGTAITWQSSNENFISSQGIVQRPSYASGDQWVQLTATITKGESARTKYFYLYLPKNDIITDEDAVAADYQELAIGFAEGDNENSVTQNLSLPHSGSHGTTVVWQSENSYVNSEGVVIRPTYSQGDQYVYLYANISKGDYNNTRTFEIRVPRGEIVTDADSVQAEYEQLNIQYAEGDNENGVNQNVTFPTTGDYGTTITWHSEHTNYLSDTGVVTRPPYSLGDYGVQVYATISKGSNSSIKYFFVWIHRSPVTTAEDEAQADYEGLEIGYASGDSAYNITQNISLPLTGTYGSSIVWSSNNTNYINSDGTVIRPLYSTGNVYVYLCAVVTKGTAQLVKNFTVCVSSNPTITDEDRAILDMNNIQIGYNSGEYQGSVMHNITLPTTGTNNSVITWSSSDENTISPSGVVTRPDYAAGNKVVQMTATITNGTSVKTRAFSLTVIRNYTDDYGNNIATAGELTVGTTTSGAIETYGDIDYFKFTAPVSDQYRMRSISNFDTYGFLYDENGNILTSNDDSGGNLQFLMTYSLEAGKTYYLAIRAYGNYYIGPYQVLVTQLNASDTDSVNDAANKLQIGYTAGDYSSSVTQNIILPATGANGTTISWTSNYTNTIGTDGTVVRPVYSEGDKWVYLTATISKGTAKATRDFSLLVKRSTTVASDKDAVYMDTDNLQIGYANGDSYGSVTQNITLPGRGEHGTTITWTSNLPSIISSEGAVTRPTYSDGSRWVYLYATITKGSETHNTYFEVLVLKNDTITDHDAVVIDNQNLQIGYASGDYYYNVNQNITLPVAGANGTTITWTSDKENIISPTGVVVKPAYTAGDTWVNLTATITKGTESITKAYQLYVKKAESQVMEFNGHYYWIIDKTISWQDAKKEAEAMTYNGLKGHLATVDTAEENAFITTLGDVSGHWIGGIQPLGSEEPAGNWQWITGETMDYTNWNYGEPNNYSSGENVMQYVSSDGRWNDLPSGTYAINGYIVEFDTTVKPEIPVVSVAAPENNGTGIAQDQVISVEFNVNINQGAGYDNIIVKDQDNNLVPIDKLLNGKVLTITPKPYLATSKTYTVSIPANSITNSWDENMASDYSFSFATKDKWDNVAPVISKIETTAGNQLGGDTTPRIKMFFTENDSYRGLSATLEVSRDNGANWQSIGSIQGPFDSGDGTRYFYGDWSLKDVQSGTYLIKGTVTDRSGNTNSFTQDGFTVDRTAPAVPANLTVDFDSNGIKLDWYASTSADTSYYKVYRRMSGDQDFSYYATIMGRNNVTFTDGNVQAGKTYEYKVSAVDGFYQESVATDAVSLAVESDTTNPVVLGIEPLDGKTIGKHTNIIVRAQDNFILTSITLQYLAGDNGTWTDIATVNTRNNATFDWDIGSLTGTVKLRALAKDFAGNVSDGSPIRNYTIDVTGPGKVEGIGNTPSTTSVLLKWNDVADEDFDHFLIERKDSETGDFQSIGTTSDKLWWNATGLQPDTTYWFRVTAYDKLGNRGTSSDIEMAKTVTDTTVPTVTGYSPMPAAFSQLIHLSSSAWDNVGIATIKLQYSTDNGANWTDLQTFNPSGLPSTTSVNYDWDISSLDEGKVLVRAIVTDIAGNSSTTSSPPMVEYMIDHTAPAVPTGLQLNASGGDITLTWNKGTETDLLKYSVYRAIEDGSFSLLAGDVRTVTEDNHQIMTYVDGDVEQGKTYKYKVVAIDAADNASDKTDAVSGVLASDTENPRIISLSPASLSTLSRNPNIGVLAADNYRLSEISLEYQKQGDNSWTLIDRKAQTSPSAVGIFSWDTTGLSDGDYVLKAYAKDRAGLTSEPVTATYHLNITPPAAPVLSAVPGGWKMSLFWTKNTESDLAGYRLYRSLTPDGPYTKIAELPNDKPSYEDTMLKPGNTYYYVVDVLDTYLNTARSNQVAVSPLSDDPYPPTANAGDDQVSAINSEVGFDGTLSTDNDRIASYHWDFGDGSISNSAKPIHVYTAAGQYTATLTVTDPAGNTAQDSALVTVKDPASVGNMEIQVVDDATGIGLSEASVVLQLPDGTMQKFIADGYGKVNVSTVLGSFKVFGYKTDYKPGSMDIKVEANKKANAILRLTAGKLVVGQLTVKRMTISEIEASGIDTTAPENQWVYKFEVHLAFNNQPLPVNTYVVNGVGGFLGSISSGGALIGTISPISVGGVIAYPVAIPHPQHPEVRPTIAYMVIPGEAKWLKEFFEVGLTLENTADPQFIIADSTATLKLPDGLTLAPTKIPQSLTVNLGDIAGQQTKEVKWVIRGDKKGSYSLEADFNGTLKPFDDPVSQVFKTADPFRVWGDDAIKLHIDAQERADKGSPYHVRFGIENVSDVPVYNPSIELKDDTKQNYIYAPNQELSKTVSELPAGQTLWADYWLIPSISGHLDLSNSYVLKTGTEAANVQSVLTSRSDPENYPPTVPVLYQVRNTNGTVTLSWGSIADAKGYRIYSIRDDLYMSKAPELVYEATAAENAVTLTEASSKDYMITTLLPDGSNTKEQIRHAITGLSWCGSAGNPVITIDPMELHVGQASDILMTVNQQGFPVVGGTVDVGSYITGKTLDDNGQARINITPTVPGDIIVSAYDSSHHLLTTKTIKVVGDNVAPALPTGFHVVATTTDISLLWNANPEQDIAGYNLYGWNNGTFTKLNTNLITAASYTLSGVTKGTIYSFKLSAVDNSGNESEKAGPISAGIANDTNPSLDIVRERVDSLGITNVNVVSGVTNAAVLTGGILNPPSGGRVSTLPLPEININVETPISVNPIKVQIPKDTVFSGPENWDGTIHTPTIKDNSLAGIPKDASKTTSVKAVVEIGFDDVLLTMNKAVRIVLPGQAGNLVGFTRAGSFTKITATLSADTQEAADREIAAGGDAAMDVGSDKVVWTKHLTKFVTYTQSEVTPPTDILTFSSFILKGTTPLNAPSDSVVDSKGNLYVTDYYNNRIVEFDSNGNWINAYGTKGDGIGNFFKPTGIAIDEADQIYVADTYNNRIVVFKDADNNGTIDSSEWKVYGSAGSGILQFNKPLGLYVKAGKIYVADTYNNRVASFEVSDPTGSWSILATTAATSGKLKLPTDVVVASDGNLWVSDTYNNRVVQFSEAGEYIASYAESLPFGITADSNNNIYIAERQTAKIKRINNAKDFGGKAVFTSPIGINVDGNGYLWVVDVTTGSIKKAKLAP